MQIDNYKRINIVSECWPTVRTIKQLANRSNSLIPITNIVIIGNSIFQV